MTTGWSSHGIWKPASIFKKSMYRSMVRLSSPGGSLQIWKINSDCELPFSSQARFVMGKFSSSDKSGRWLASALAEILRPVGLATWTTFNTGMSGSKVCVNGFWCYRISTLYGQGPWTQDGENRLTEIVEQQSHAKIKWDLVSQENAQQDSAPREMVTFRLCNM